MSAKMDIISKSAQWFEDNSPLMPEHKKENVVGISYKTVIAAAESGATSPATPIGVNLPNADWRSEEHTSELQSRPHLVCRLLLEKKKNNKQYNTYIL